MLPPGLGPTALWGPPQIPAKRLLWRALLSSTTGEFPAAPPDLRPGQRCLGLSLCLCRAGQHALERTQVNPYSELSQVHTYGYTLAVYHQLAEQELLPNAIKTPQLWLWA